ncbi:MAG: cell division protein FtsA [Thermodesulfobacteriota bacterium]
MARKENNMVVGLDIGTTKICAIVGEKVNDRVEIVGVGTSVSKGLRKGVVVNIDSTVQSIKKAIEDAELMAGCEISSVYAGISGRHIKGFNSHGVVAVKEKEVKEGDLKRVIDAAKAVPLPLDREVLHVLPQEYIIDEQDGVQEPLGMSGVRLEAMVHIVTAAVTSTQNVVKSANRAGLNVEDMVLQQLASSESTLCADEKELGIVLIDIGGGTTDIAIFTEGTIKYTSVLPLGGNQITGDIAVGLRTPTAEAEKIKIKYGCAVASMIDRDENIEVPSVGGRNQRILSRQILGEIIEPRVEEIFTLVNDEIVKSGYEGMVASGILLTGGSALMSGIVEAAERIFNLPVRLGYPTGVGGLVDIVKNPQYATGVGLVQRAWKASNGKHEKSNGNGFIKGVAKRTKQWLGDFF